MRQSGTVFGRDHEQLEAIAIVDRMLVVQVQFLLPAIESLNAANRLCRVVELDVVREAAAVRQRERERCIREQSVIFDSDPQCVLRVKVSDLDAES